jgi:PEP-CTERM motif
MCAGVCSVRLILAALLSLIGITRDAAATVTIDLEWSACGGGNGGCTATGTDIITVNPGGGQTLRLDVYLSHDLTQGIFAQSFSLNFDTQLQNELNLGPMAQTEWIGTDLNPGPNVLMYLPYTAGLTTLESTGSTAGRINSFESATDAPFNGVLPANGAAYSVGSFTATAPARYRVGQAFFTTNGAITDGADVFAGLFNLPGLFDVFIDGNDVLFTEPLVVGTATLNVIPEPGTVSLLGLGLVGLVLTGRRPRRV